MANRDNFSAEDIRAKLMALMPAIEEKLGRPRPHAIGTGLPSIRGNSESDFIKDALCRLMKSSGLRQDIEIGQLVILLNLATDRIKCDCARSAFGLRRKKAKDGGHPVREVAWPDSNEQETIEIGDAKRADSPLDRQMAAEAFAILLAVLDSDKNPAAKDLAIWRFVEELSYTEIAELSGTSPKAVEYQLRTLRDRLKRNPRLRTLVDFLAD